MSEDVVGIFDADGNQLLPEGRPIKAEVKLTAKVMEHPLESGASVADHKVTLPIELDVTLVIVDEAMRDAYRKLRDVFGQKETVTVQTRADVYESMTIEAMPHDETADAIGALPVVVKFREVVFVETQFQPLPAKAAGSGAGKRNASTVKRGEQSGKPEGSGTSGQKKSSVLYGLFYGKGGG